jgi:predicted permease
MFTDLRYAVRQLAKSPGFTAVVVLSLALGIGSVATVACWMQNILYRPIPGAVQQQELVVLVSNQGGGNVSQPDLRDFVAQGGVFADAALTSHSSACLTVESQPGWIEAQLVSANFFELLGIRPIVGRTFLAGEDQKPGGDPVMVISERLWRRQFESDPSVVGRVVDLNRHAFTIIGVVPSEFRGSITGLSFDVWAPLSMIGEVRNQRYFDDRSARGWHNVARLGASVTVAEAQAVVTTLDVTLTATYPDTNRDIHHRVLPYSQCPWGAQAVLGPGLRLLFAMSGGVLLIVVANVANLQLARAVSRQKEIAIRLAAGASRARLIRQMLTESLVLAGLGGIGGVILASWGVNLLAAFVSSLPANAVLTYEVDGATVAFTTVVTLGTCLLFGLVPAIRASRVNLEEALKNAGRGTGAAGVHHRLRSGLVISEVALALVLLVAAGLCLKGLRAARQMDFGLNPEGVLLGGLQIGMNGYDRTTGLQYYRELRQRLADTPGVEEAALASWYPLGLAGCKGSDVRVEGYTPPLGDTITYEYAIVSPRYFAVMQIPVLAGRDFTDGDDTDAPRVAIVNEHFARRFWPDRDAIGQKFRSLGEWRTVVGVVKTGKYNRLDESARSFYYRPYLQGVPDLDLSLSVRTHGKPEAFAPALREVVRGLDPRVDLVVTRTMAAHTQAVLFAQRMVSGLLTLLGGIALALAALGVYAVMAYAVSQRTREFGVRLALGAQRWDVLWQVVRRGLGLTLAGIVAGLGLAVAVTRLLSAFLYGVSPFDWETFLSVSLLLAVIAVLACWIPAARATRVNPVIALRAE